MLDNHITGPILCPTSFQIFIFRVSNEAASNNIIPPAYCCRQIIAHSIINWKSDFPSSRASLSVIPPFGSEFQVGESILEWKQCAYSDFSYHEVYFQMQVWANAANDHDPVFLTNARSKVNGARHNWSAVKLWPQAQIVSLRLVWNV